MEIRHKLISADSHAAFENKDTFTSRMSATKWGDKIPHVAPSERGEEGERVDGWSCLRGATQRYGVCNCPAVMGEPFPNWPKRWEEIPLAGFKPLERLKAWMPTGSMPKCYFRIPRAGRSLNLGMPISSSPWYGPTTTRSANGPASATVTCRWPSCPI